jgi:sugar/nucleoside kinase (ribokinase family)
VTAILRSLESAWKTVDAWIVLDQVSEVDCGVVTARVRTRLAELAAADPHRFVLADSRERIREFRHVCVKPNAREGKDVESIRAACSRTVFLTQGEAGIRVYAPCAHPIDVPAYPVSCPVDTVGAGDSVGAGIASAIAAGTTPAQAAAFGNLVASITVQQLGTTGTATPEQVRARWREIQSVS